MVSNPSRRPRKAAALKTAQYFDLPLIPNFSLKLVDPSGYSQAQADFAAVMNWFWPKIALLGMFAFWASGTAKYAHEQLEHHGRDMADIAGAGVDDDDDDSSAIVAQSTPAPSKDQRKHDHHPCPVCQMLAGMTADRSTPPALPLASNQCIAVLLIPDRETPAVCALFAFAARGPPASLFFH